MEQVKYQPLDAEKIEHIRGYIKNLPETGTWVDEDFPRLLATVDAYAAALREIAEIRTTAGSGLHAVDIARSALAATQAGE